MRHAYHVHDFILGHILFFVLIFMAALQFPKDIQTWLLFHNALSQGVVIEDILKYARKSQEQSAGSEDAISEDATELKKVLNQQVRYIIHYTAYFTARYV
jgi:callose synthase